MEHRDAFLLEVIIDFCDRIAASLAKPEIDYQAFLDNLDLQDVSAFRILQIGENANNLSNTFKTKHPQIPWYKISGFRNVVAHEYGDVEPAILWETLTVDIPKLRDFCAKIIQ